MVGIDPKGPFCEMGVPIVDHNGALLAIGAARQAKEGGFLTQMIDVGAIRATLEAWTR